MATYRVCVNRTTKTIYVLPVTTAAPAGSVIAGTFNHDGADIFATPDQVGSSVSHVLFQHVQEVMYHAKDSNPVESAMFPANITDLGNYKILNTV